MLYQYYFGVLKNMGGLRKEKAAVTINQQLVGGEKEEGKNGKAAVAGG